MIFLESKICYAFQGNKKPAKPFGLRVSIWFSIWWRRGELNPRPQVLRHKVYMLIPLFWFSQWLPVGPRKSPAIP